MRSRSVSKRSLLTQFIVTVILWGAVSEAVLALPARIRLQQPFRELEDFDYWANLCRLQSKAEAFTEALEACDEAILIEPKDPDIWSDRSYVLLRLNRYAEGVASAENAIRFRGNYSEAQTWRCLGFSGLNREEEALDACEAALLADAHWRNTNPAEAWFFRGESLTRLGRHEDAVVSYERALVIEPEYSLALARQCEALSQLQRPLEALTSCDAALAQNQNWGTLNESLAWGNRALAFDQLQGDVQAIASLDQALKQSPRNPMLWAQQGMLLAQQKNYPEALLSFTQAVNIKPDYTLALVKQCTALNKLQRYEAALTACEQALAGDGSWDKLGVAEAWDQLTITLTQLGRYEDAIATANRAVGFQPDFAEAWNNRGVPYWYLGRYNESLASYDRAIALNPRYVQAWINRGRVFLSLQRYNEALIAYDQALSIDPQSDVAWANRSVILWHLRDYSGAIRAADQALALNPRSTLAWFAKGEALAALRRYEAALVAYREALAISPERADLQAAVERVLLQLTPPEQDLPFDQTLGD
ncbi:tetratricopeptide repeat protein [Spirulina subsalsa]|uniref:tetratricopeptide repeat protein n=1 Tax=Spirulina subsalsa TaxID=54311 RepID=UPI0013E05EBA|nr:tetratricopeptide repeat protein [Spirulina subsalsa]